jgi:hypothetical protein
MTIYFEHEEIKQLIIRELSRSGFVDIVLESANGYTPAPQQDLSGRIELVPTTVNEVGLMFSANLPTTPHYRAKATVLSGYGTAA